MLEERTKTDGNHYWLTAGNSVGEDAVNSVFDLFPVAIGATCAVVVVLVGIAFRSAVVPLRAVVTIAVTVAMVYGLATLTYENGIFDWTHFAGIEKTGALTWITPVMMFSILVGLGLDYGMF